MDEDASAGPCVGPEVVREMLSTCLYQNVNSEKGHTHMSLNKGTGAFSDCLDLFRGFDGLGCPVASLSECLEITDDTSEP